jgi:tetratricopeptide (TPR) repeat protein
MPTPAERAKALLTFDVPSLEQIDAINNLAQELQEVDRQNCLMLSKEAASLSFLLKYSLGEARAHNRLGWLSLQEGRLDIAMHHAMRASDLATANARANATSSDTMVHTRLRCGALFVSASVHQRVGNTAFALRDWFQLLHLALKANDLAYEADAYSQLGVLYREQKEFSEAINCHRQALKRYVALGDVREVFALNNMAHAYARNNEGVQALVYARMALDKCPLNWPAMRANFIDTLGRACLANGDTRIALAQFESGIKLYQTARITGQVHADSVIATLYQSAALALRKLGQLDQVAIKLDQALVEAERANDQPLQAEIHQDTANLMILLGALEMARHHQAKASALSFKLEHEQVVLRERVLKVFRAERNCFGLELSLGRVG